MRTAAVSRSLALALALAGCGHDAPPAAVAHAELSSSPVAWVTARSAASSMLLEAPARILDGRAGRAAVTPPLRARIVAVLVEPGAVVAAGAPVVEVALPEVAAAAAAYLAAEGELAAHERRAGELAKLRAEGLVRAAEVSAVELEVARLRGARELAATTLRAAGLAPGDARGLAASGGRTVLRAPIAGTVLAVSAVVGATRMPEDVLVELADGASRRVEARLARPLPPDVGLEFVPLGGPAVAVRLVGSAGLREQDGSTRAWFELEAAAPAGTTGRIRVSGELAGVAIPAAAVARGERGAATVWRNQRGTPQQVPVRVIASSGGDVIVDGIAVGDEIAGEARGVSR